MKLFALLLTIISFNSFAINDIDLVDRKVSWSSRKGFSYDGLITHLDKMQAKGYRSRNIEAYQISNETRFSIQLVKDGNSSILDAKIKRSEFSEHINKRIDQNYRMIDIEYYETAGIGYIASIWVRNSAKVAWSMYRDMSFEVFAKTLKELDEKGLQPFRISSYKRNNKINYSAIWVKTSSFTLHRYVRGVTMYGTFPGYFDLIKSGYIPVSIDSDKGERFTYNVIFAQRTQPFNLSVESKRLDLEKSDYQLEVNKLVELGYRIESSDISVKDNIEYATGIFLREPSNVD